MSHCSNSRSSSTRPLQTFCVGLTGGIGSGKSTVADLLATHGAAVIDTDAIAHTLTAAGGAAMPAIRQQFGDAFIAADGALDRARMRAAVFFDAEAKRKLEAILHPLIRQSADAQAAASRDAPYAVFVVPLLVESGSWIQRVDRVLLVDCSVATQIERVQRRSQLPRQQIEAIVAQQATRADRLNAAHDVLFNELDRADLAARVQRLHTAYLHHANR